MRTNYLLRLSLILSCIVLSVSTLHAQTDAKINIGFVSMGEISYAGFKLNKDATINISGKGASFTKWGNNLMFYGWIIESESREVIWSVLDEYENKFLDGEGSFSFNVDKKLETGSYEIYYTAIHDNSFNKNYGNSYYDNSVNSISDLVHVVKEIINYDDYPDYGNKEYSMAVSSEDKGFTANDGKGYIDNMVRKSIVSFVRTGDDKAKSKNFALNKETKLYIYCQGEKQEREFFDFAWIYDLRTHEKIWPNTLTDFDRAGGGRKNFAVYQEIKLPAGEYQVNYSTDGSHSFEKWNVMPPNDPQFWGIAMWCDTKDTKNVSEEVIASSPVIDLTKIRDNDLVSQGFEIINPIDLRVICLGEAADYEPNDYGWIIDAKSREIVWKFSRARSEYAGGASKNRIVNEVISLNKGKYIAYFISDDSHSYHDWNLAPPHDQKLWGLSLWPVNAGDKSAVKLYNEEELNDENLIVKITKVRDSQRDYKEFSLDKEMKVRIYAIGEGNQGRMYDTGWIKNTDSGKIVWELTYRTSEHAGGASKNRLYNNFILLPAGNYRLYFESDGSHSYMGWNDDPPYDQMNYGIKILKE